MKKNQGKEKEEDHVRDQTLKKDEAGTKNRKKLLAPLLKVISIVNVKENRSL